MNSIHPVDSTGKCSYGKKGALLETFMMPLLVYSNTNLIHVKVPLVRFMSVDYCLKSLLIAFLQSHVPIVNFETNMSSISEPV